MGGALAIGGLNGVLLAPAARLVPLPRLVAREADPPPRTRGFLGALDGEPRFAVPPLGRVNPLADTRPYLEQSPSLARALDGLLRRGWEIRYGDPADGTFTNHAQRLIQIASDHASPEEVAQALAHEAGHALDGRMRPFFATPGDLGRWQLEGEGKAVLFNTKVRDEILANTGVDIGVNGDAAGPVSAIAHSSLSEAEKLRKIADIFAKAHPSGTGPHVTYEYYYGARNKTLEQLRAFWERITGRAS